MTSAECTNGLGPRPRLDVDCEAPHYTHYDIWRHTVPQSKDTAAVTGLVSSTVAVGAMRERLLILDVQLSLLLSQHYKLLNFFW